MEEVALKLEVHDDKAKQKAIWTVPGLSGVDTNDMDSKEKKLTATRYMDHEYPPPIPANYTRVVDNNVPGRPCVIL